MAEIITAIISFLIQPTLIYIFMGCWFIFSCIYIYLKKKNNKVNDYIYDSIPSMFVTLGVLGTFGGIFIGLQNFQVDTMENIEKSIPALLEGLRGAFSTSIIGMLLSLFVGRISDWVQGVQETTNHIPSNEEQAILDVNVALSSVVKELQTLNISFESKNSSSIPNQLKVLRVQSEKQLSLVEENGVRENQLLLNISENIQEISEHIQENTKKGNQLLINISEHIQENTKKESQLLTNISERIQIKGEKQTSALGLIETQAKAVNDSVLELKKRISKQHEEEISVIGDIKQQMLANQTFLDGKFTEFAKLLADNNTKALVEVMKEATNQFNHQMKELIDKLVKENFKELNNSVQQLNSWQKQNKEQVATLIETFNEVTQNFESTSSSINTITINTEKLTDKNSYLSVLIQELQKVMIEDTKFQEITKMLVEAVETVKGNIKSFDKTTGKFTTTVGLVNANVESLNSWQEKNRKQVVTLINTFDKATANFENASESIKTITENTEKLTDKNSHLSNLIQELQKVMIEDTKFQEITNKLTATVDTVQNNINSFDKTTNKLNKWVLNQMNFSDSVTKLLSRLEKIDKIKDVNDMFWKETKKQLNEGVSIISKANKKLSTDIDAINTEFYERLNDTLQNLDNLIIRIIEEHTV